MTQLPLFTPTRQEREFREFHDANPAVYAELRKLALQLRAAGRTRYGIMALLNIVRWQRALKTTDDEFKLNNNFAPFYARLIAEQEPTLRYFFSMRRSIADESPEGQAVAKQCAADEEWLP
jgi:hypothetical protein